MSQWPTKARLCDKIIFSGVLKVIVEYCLFDIQRTVGALQTIVWPIILFFFEHWDGSDSDHWQPRTMCSANLDKVRSDAAFLCVISLGDLRDGRQYFLITKMT